jgi:hypothetical protein
MEPLERELKFVLDDARVARFLVAASAELALEIHAAHAPVSYTRTTYLDNDELGLLRAPGPVRRRLRIREYSAATDPVAAPSLTGVSYLESKESCGGHRNKARVRLSAGSLGELLAGDSRSALHLLGCTSPDLRSWLREQQVRPRMTTWYRRTSMVAPGLRVTLDHGVAFCAPEMQASTGSPARPAHVVATWPGTVLEIKLVGALPEWLAREVEGLGEAIGLSKFEAGMHAMTADAVRAA